LNLWELDTPDGWLSSHGEADCAMQDSGIR
jgi:hypothetical protein